MPAFKEHKRSDLKSSSLETAHALQHLPATMQW